MQSTSIKTFRAGSPRRLTRPLVMLLAVIAGSHIAISPELQHSLAAFAAAH